MVMSMKMAVSWDVVLRSLVDINQCFRGAYYIHHHGDPDDGGSKFL
jgi:hypothetical protein